ncbi:MAG: succinate dehydrogenase/fumarate reductase iron-sulfur subunit [Nitrospirota bacterium]
MRVTLHIQKYNPEIDSKPHEEPYRLDVGRGTTVLEALMRLKNDADGTLTFRYACRSAICGSCAMEINGTEKLACKTQIRPELERHGEIRIGPLKNLPLIKDLVVAMQPFWEKVQSIRPWLEPLPHEQVDAARMRDAYKAFNNVEACIMCGACVAACTVYEVEKGFAGPAALAKAYRFVADPREAAVTERLDRLQGDGGIWDCTRCNYCVEVCPKDVKPMEAIILLRRASIESGLTETLGSRHITRFVDIIRHEGRLNEGLMPMKVIGFRIKDLLRILPLGIKMFLKGKVPFPFKLRPAIPGIKQVRAIFAARNPEKKKTG